MILPIPKDTLVIISIYLFLFIYFFPKNKTNQSYRNKEVMYLLYQAAITTEISILLLCFCSFDLFCPLLDKDISNENIYIVLSCPIK